MTPTPVPEFASAPSMAGFWTIVGFIGLVVLLLVIGLITGQVRLTPSKTRESTRRGMLTMDAVFSTPEKQAAIQYIRDEEHLIEPDQERGEGDGNDAEALLFQWQEDDDGFD
jgi:hypothetical protein